MRILVLGGTAFLSAAVAAEAVRSGHEVTCAARGTSGVVPDGARHVFWDRDEPVPAELGTSYDAVIDVARHPSRVRRAVAALPEAHWVFVSTISVYADHATPGGGPGSLELLPAIATDEDLSSDPDAYGGMKLACEELVRGQAASACVVRPGLIVGPGDPSGRFTYWPHRLASVGPGEDVVAPGAPEELMQVIDVRDLAAWIVALAEARTTGTFDAVGPALPLGRLLDDVAAGVGAEPRWVWLGHEELAARSVDPWSGPRSIPLWLPRPEYDGMVDHDRTDAVAAGLRTRPIAETARDTAQWLANTPDAVVTGLTRAEELAVLGGH